jgi:hypothetical protein
LSWRGFEFTRMKESAGQATLERKKTKTLKG